MTLNAADRKSIRRAEKAFALAEQNRRATFIDLVSKAVGREYVWNLLSRANVFASTFNEDPGRMAFLEGQRSSGLALLDDFMQWAPDQFILAMREQNARRTTADTIDRNETGNGANGEHPGGEEPGREPEGYAGDADDVGDSHGDGDEARH